MTAGSQGFAEGGLGLWEGQGQAEARRPWPDPGVQPPMRAVSGLSPESLKNNAKQTNKSQIKRKGKSGQAEQRDPLIVSPSPQSAQGPVGVSPGSTLPGPAPVCLQLARALCEVKNCTDIVHGSFLSPST